MVGIRGLIPLGRKENVKTFFPTNHIELSYRSMFYLILASAPRKTKPNRAYHIYLEFYHAPLLHKPHFLA
jgi:hypothetical protein